MIFDKAKTASIALILFLIITAIITLLPTANAANVPTYGFLTVAPDPIGVGQTATIVMWLSNAPLLNPATLFAITWEDFEVTVTKPDQTIQTLGPFTSDPVGSAWTQFTPQQIGTYTFQLIFPGQHVEGLSLLGGGFLINDYQASTSPLVELTVQQDPIEAYPDWPLPDENEFWDRPIEAENRDWWSLSGNWLMSGYNATGTGGRYNPYTKAPNTAHIVWTKPISFGGLVGGEFGALDYYEGRSYESKWDPPVIMNGRLYYNTPDPPRQGFYCVDLRTGETLWYQNTTANAISISGFNVLRQGSIFCGQLLDMETPNQHGVIPYLWGISGATGTYELYDAFTGNLILTLENASTGTVMFSEKGDLLVYILDGQNNWLAMWNSTKAIPMAGLTGTDAWQWRPELHGKTFDWRDGIQWNVTVSLIPGQSITKIHPDVILAFSIDVTTWPITVTHIGYSAKTGERMWIHNRTTQLEGMDAFGSFGPMMGEVYTEWIKEKMQWNAYDVYTGNQVWGPTEPYTNAWGMYKGWGIAPTEVIAFGNFYASAYDGMIHCYDIETGQHLWDYYTGSSGFETPYGHWPFHGTTLIAADGKIYGETGEHSATKPLWRGERLHCVDAEIGELVWNVLGWYEGMAVADGYLVTFNGADNQIYCFGKGETTVTVDAPMNAISLGDSVVFRGSVTDQSPGAEGTPAIGDEYMTEWMEYLYMQKPCPTTANGVEVKLETLDPNNNFYEIGTVTSDSSGMFKLMWEPPVPGEYTIIATFEGSDSYFSSYAETAIGVTEAPSPGEPIEPEPVEPAEAPLISIEVAIIIAVAVIIGIVAFWTLRKCK